MKIRNLILMPLAIAIAAFAYLFKGQVALADEKSGFLQVYISLRDDDTIVRFQLSKATGELIRQDDFPLEGGPAVLRLTPDRRRIYIGLRKINKVGILGLAPDGMLTVESVSPLGLNPTHLALDPNGSTLYAASYGNNAWSAHPIRTDGSVGSASLRVNEIAKAHQMVIGESDNWVMVPALGMDAVLIYERSRLLAGEKPEPIHTLRLPSGAGPRHLVWHPTQPRFFVANETHSSVTTARWEAEKPALVSGPEVSSLPSDYDGPNTCAQIKISPDGRHLYVANRGHDSIAVFDILENDPGVALKANVPAEAKPRVFALDPSGRWLISVGQDSGYMILYERDAETGMLTRKERHYVGKMSFWVDIFELPAKSKQQSL